jgi:hypothetical protein
MTNERVIEQLRKLIAHQRSAEKIGSLAEAAAFANTIQRLLEKHHLELSDVHIDATADEVGEERWEAAPFGLPRRRTGWLERIALAVAHTHFCRVILIRGLSSLYLIGRAADREVAAFMIVYLSRAGRALCDAELALSRRTNRRLRPAAFRNSFLFSFATEIALRLFELKNSRLATYGEEGLVVLNRADADAEAFAARRPGTKPCKTLDRANNFSRSGAALGRFHGRRLDIGVRPIGSGRPAKALPAAPAEESGS